MAIKNKRPYTEIFPIAEEVLNLLKPFSERIEISGSLRRKKELVGDIELITIPKYESRLISSNLFDEEERKNIDLMSEFILQDERFKMRPNKNGNTSYGSYNKLLLYKDFPLDIFTANENNWFTVSLTRCGGSKSNIRIFGTFQKLGMHFSIHEGITLKNGTVYFPKSEEEIFELASLNYLSPEKRE